MKMMSKLKTTNVILLALGCAGSSEMIIAYFHWHQIMNLQSLVLFRPGEPIAQLSALGILFGFLGWFAYVIEAIRSFTKKSKEISRLAFIFFYLFTFEFIWMAYLYRGV